MDALTSRPATTLEDGREIPEAEVARGGPVTQRGAARPRRGAAAPAPGPEMSAPMQVREAAAPAPGQVFETRKAVTVIIPPPRWAEAEQRAKENDHATFPSTDADRGQD